MEGGNGAQGATMSQGVAQPVGNAANISEARSVREEKTVIEPVSVSEIKPKVVNPQVQESEDIEKIAKEKGVDDALEALAKDDYIADEVEASREDEEKPEVPIELQIQELLDKVEKFTDGNSEKVKKLEEAQETNKLAVMGMYEMAQVLRKLIEESEIANKTSLLALLVRAMRKLIEAMVMDENGGVAARQTADNELEKMAA